MFQELYSYHREAFSSTLTGKPVPKSAVPFLSHQTQVFLKHIFLQDSALGHALLQALKVKDNDLYIRNNALLQGLHLKCLNVLLETLKGLASDSQEEGSPSKTVRHFLELLSLFNPDSDMVKDPQVTTFLHDLCLFILQTGSGNLPLRLIYSALLGRADTDLLEKLCTVEYEVRMKKHEESVSLDKGNSTAEMSKLHKYMLSLSFNPDRPHAWKDLYLLCLKQETHFLDLIMVGFIITVGIIVNLSTLPLDNTSI